MDEKTLRGLQQLNQLALTPEEEALTLGFFADRARELQQLEAIDTTEVTRMVWVNPMENVLRDDKIIQTFSREDLQKQAPEVMNDYWQVPRVAN